MMRVILFDEKNHRKILRETGVRLDDVWKRRVNSDDNASRSGLYFVLEYDKDGYAVVDSWVVLPESVMLHKYEFNQAESMHKFTPITSKE